MANAATTYSKNLRTADNASAIAGLSSAVQAPLLSPEHYSRFEQAERSAIEKTLPDGVIPHSLCISSPECSGRIAPMPTIPPAVAQCASAIASPLIVGMQSFNLLQNWNVHDRELLPGAIDRTSDHAASEAYVQYYALWPNT